MPLVMTQFREPKLGIEDMQTTEDQDDPVNQEEFQRSTVTIRRPSDFRRFALAVQRLQAQREEEEGGVTREPSEPISNAIQFARQQPTKCELLEDIDKLVAVVKW